ncbi:MAG: glycosyltransferase [Patescibacteria group bacterium]|nr:glycosyltransferase [Patescibacteria group bacterium]
MKNRVSVCVTVFNEKDSIGDLIKSLCFNKDCFHELVICDGGSIDQTDQIVKNLSKDFKWIKFIVSKGNVAHGRNVAVKNASGDIIAMTDAGCIVQKNWVKKMTQPLFDGKYDISAGFYNIKTRNSFQKALGFFRGVNKNNYNSKTFIPSCRSVAFKKKVWICVGGFDEKLSLSGEDTKFFYEALKSGFKMKKVKGALVDWVEPEKFGIKDIFKFYFYARGDAQTGIWWDPIKKWRTHNIKIFSIFLRYVFFIACFFFDKFFGAFVFTFYLLWAFTKVFRNQKDFYAGFWGMIIQIFSDFLIMAGFVKGLIK